MTYNFGGQERPNLGCNLTKALGAGASEDHTQQSTTRFVDGNDEIIDEVFQVNFEDDQVEEVSGTQTAIKDETVQPVMFYFACIMIINYDLSIIQFRQ